MVGIMHKNVDQKWIHSGQFMAKHLAYEFQPDWSTNLPQNLFMSIKHVANNLGNGGGAPWQQLYIEETFPWSTYQVGHR